jgi:hypothetical protein
VRRTHYLLFLAFYFASSYVVSQERTRIVVGEVQDSTSESDEVRIEGSRSPERDIFPNYKQARPRVISVVHVGVLPQGGVVPNLSEGSLLGSSNNEVQSRPDTESFLSRAPPFQS